MKLEWSGVYLIMFIRELYLVIFHRNNSISGTGLGNKTIGQIIKEMGLDTAKVYQRLKAIHIEAEDEDRLKSLAERNNTTPLRLMTAILVEDGRIDKNQ